MKALTVIAPWGSLLAWREKEYETRGWGTDHRGQIAIHQGKNTDCTEELAEILFSRHQLKRWPIEGSPDLDYEDYTWLAMKKYGYRRVADFPRGFVLGTADLVDCIRMTPAFIEQQTPKELALGAWSVGRYALKYANVKLFDTPIPASGKQGLWDWEGA